MLAPQSVPMTPTATRPATPHNAQEEDFGRIPESPWKRKDLSNRAARVLGGLTILAGCRNWICATFADVAQASGVSIKTVQRAVDELVEKRIVDWDQFGHTFTFLFRLKGPVQTRQPAPEREIHSRLQPKLSTGTGQFCPHPTGQNCPPVAARHIGTPARLIQEPERERESRNDNDGIASAKQTAEIDACTSSLFPILPIPESNPISVPVLMPAPASIPAPTPIPDQTVDQQELGRLVARIVLLYHVAPEEAREKLLSLVNQFTEKARKSGIEFGLWWLADVIDSAERRPKKSGNLPVYDWKKYLRGGLSNILTEGGMNKPKPKPSADAPPCSKPPAASVGSESTADYLARKEREREAAKVTDPLPAGYDWRKEAAEQAASMPSTTESRSQTIPTNRR